MNYNYGEGSNYGYREGANYGYGENTNYGRRGVPGSGRGRRYRGEEMIEEMKEHFNNYSEGKEESMRGNYGAEGFKEKAFDYMLKSAKEFFMFLMEDSENPEQMEKVRKTARQISEMR